MTPINRYLARRDLAHRYLAGGLIVVALNASPAFASTSSPLVDDARTSIAQGNANAALIRLKNAVRENPTSGEARFELGALEARLGDLIAAEKDLTLARDNAYPPAQVNPLLGFVLLALGENEKLLATVAPCPDDAQCRSDVLAFHTRARLALRDVPGADTASTAALEAVPSNPAAQLARVLVLMAHSDYRTAEEMVDGVLATDAKSAEALGLKGDLRRQAGDLGGAIDRFQASLAVNSRDIAVRQRLGLALAASNRDEEAAAEVKTVLDQAPKALIALYLKAMLEVRAGKVADALNTVRPVEAAVERIPRGIFLLAVIHTANAHLEQALDYATKFHAGEPNNAVGAKLLASLYYRLRAYAKVIDVLGPLQDHFADDAEALNLLGSAYMAEGWVKEANEVLAKVVAITPNDTASQARLAIAQTRQASTRDVGVHELESLVAADAKNVRVGVALLFSYLSRGEYDRAIDAATTMVKAQPESPLPLTIRGSVWLAKGDEAAALGDFQAALEKNRDFVPAASYVAELDMRNENFDHARTTIDDLLSRAPNDLRALMVRVRIEVRAGKPEAVVPYLRTAISAYPDEAEPRIQLMQTLAGLGRTDDAILAVDDLVRTQPHNPAAIDLAARTYLALKQPAKGIELYRRLQSSFPESPAIHQRLGQVLAGLNRLEDARTALDRAVSADRGFIPAWRSRVLLELKMNGFDAAEAVVAKAVAQNADNDEARLLEGDLLTAAGRLPEAEKSYASVLAAKPSSVAAGRVFRTVLQQGDRPRARAVLIDWLRVKPDDTGALMALAEDNLISKDYQSAIAQYESLSKTDPKNALIFNNLAYAYDETNDPRAIEAARAAYRLQPTSAEIIDTYAYLLYRKGDAKRGAELMRRAHAAAPKNPQIAYHLAKVRVDAKEFDEARSLLKPIIDANAVFGEAHDAHELYTRLGGG
jgi:putative PEP-CTERM system TPR-repeat lipoprotein